MNALDKAIQDLQAVVEAYARGKVDEGAFVLPANAVLAAYAAPPAAEVPAEIEALAQRLESTETTDSDCLDAAAMLRTLAAQGEQ